MSTAKNITVPNWKVFALFQDFLTWLINSLFFSSCSPVVWIQSQGGIVTEWEGSALSTGRGRLHFQGRDDTQVGRKSDHPTYLPPQVCCFLSMLAASHVSSLCQTSACLFFSLICQHSPSHLNRIWDFTAYIFWAWTCQCHLPSSPASMINLLPWEQAEFLLRIPPTTFSIFHTIWWCQIATNFQISENMSHC